MATLKKLGNISGVSEWEKLATVGDVKRFLRWLVLSVRDGTMGRQDAGTLALIGGYLLKANEGDIEARLAQLEKLLAYDKAA